MQNPSDLDGQPLELLIKIMGMTSSDNDNIALSAVRKANAKLASMGASWESILRGKVKIIGDPFASINIPEPRKTAPPSPPPRPQPAPFSTTPPPPPRSYRKTQPPPAPPKPDILERTIVNKFDGTCTKCGHKVLAGHGLAEQFKRSNGSTYWASRHNLNCPSTAPKKPTLSTDDFQ